MTQLLTRFFSATVNDYRDFDFGNYLHSVWDEQQKLSQPVASQLGAGASLIAPAPNSIAVERCNPATSSPLETYDASTYGLSRTSDFYATGSNDNAPSVSQQNVTHYPTFGEASTQPNAQSIFGSNTSTLAPFHVFPKEPYEFNIIPSERVHCSLPHSFRARPAHIRLPIPSNIEAQPSSLGLAHLCDKCNRYFHSIGELKYVYPCWYPNASLTLSAATMKTMFARNSVYRSVAHSGSQQLPSSRNTRSLDM